jgi:hypothetical protein
VRGGADFSGLEKAVGKAQSSISAFSAAAGRSFSSAAKRVAYF